MLAVLGILAVPHGAVGVVGLAGGSVQHQIVGIYSFIKRSPFRFTFKNGWLPIQKRATIGWPCRTRRSGPVDGTTVEDHGGVGGVHDGTSPQARLMPSPFAPGLE